MELWTQDEYGTVAVSSSWTMFAIITVLIVLRLHCRFYYATNGFIRGIGLDDLITVFSWMVFLVTSILIHIGVGHGLGQHMENLSGEQIKQTLKYNVIISSVLIWVFSLPKFAIVALLKRILDFGMRTSIVFWGLALSSQACILATSIWWYKQCAPVEYGWDQSIKGSCASLDIMANLGYFTSAYSAFLDTFFALYPIPLIMRLNLRLRNRVAISIALGLSALSCVISIYKLAIFGQVFRILPTDPTYPTAYLDVLGMAEGFVLIVCSSLPTIIPLFREARERTINSKGSTLQSPRQTGEGDMPGPEYYMWRRSKKFTSDGESTQRASTLHGGDEIPLFKSKTTRGYDSLSIPRQIKIADWPEAALAAACRSTSRLGHHGIMQEV